MFKIVNFYDFYRPTTTSFTVHLTKTNIATTQHTSINPAVSHHSHVRAQPNVDPKRSVRAPEANQHTFENNKNKNTIDRMAQKKITTQLKIQMAALVAIA